MSHLFRRTTAGEKDRVDGVEVTKHRAMFPNFELT